MHEGLHYQTQYIPFGSNIQPDIGSLNLDLTDEKWAAPLYELISRLDFGLTLAGVVQSSIPPHAVFYAFSPDGARCDIGDFPDKSAPREGILGFVTNRSIADNRSGATIAQILGYLVGVKVTPAR